MTSEAPQDVAALPQTEAGKRAADWMRSFALGNPAVDRAVRLIADAEREAAAGLLDQNDRLRERVEALEYAMGLAVGVLNDPDVLAPKFGSAKSILVAAVLSSGWGSGAEEAARNG